jgi:hypothetical protein
VGERRRRRGPHGVPRQTSPELHRSLSFFHLLVGTVANRSYNRTIANQRNPFRWIEYAFSAALMIVLIAMLLGEYDIGALAGANVAMILFGWVMEWQNRPGRAVNQFLQDKQVGKWRGYVFGERGYIVLSFVAKTALVWQVYFGTVRCLREAQRFGGRSRLTFWKKK